MKNKLQVIVCIIAIAILASCKGKYSKDYSITTRINDVCFSPSCNIEQYNIEKILSAKDSIDIVNFKFDSKEIADAIIYASKYLKLRIIIDERSTFKMHDARGKEYDFSVLDYLNANNVNLRIFDNEPYILHSKFLVIDNKEIVNGSGNYFKEDLNKNFESFISFYDTTHFRMFKKEFENLWEGKLTYTYADFDGKKNKRQYIHIAEYNTYNNSTSGKEILNFEVKINNAFFSSSQGLFEQYIIDNIRSCKDSIFVLASMLYEKSIIDELANLSKSGKKVKIVTNVLGGKNLISLTNANTDVRVCKNEKEISLMHNKIILIDNNIVLCGSVNFFDQSLNKDIETLLKFNNKQLSNTFYKYCFQVWNSESFISKK